MSLCISSKGGVRAKKAYRCVFCEEVIEAGSLYDRRSGVETGDIWIMRMHPECHKKEKETPWQEREEWYENFNDGPVFERPRADAQKGTNT